MSISITRIEEALYFVQSIRNYAENHDGKPITEKALKMRLDTIEDILTKQIDKAKAQNKSRIRKVNI